MIDLFVLPKKYSLVCIEKDYVEKSSVYSKQFEQIY